MLFKCRENHRNKSYTLLIYGIYNDDFTSEVNCRIFMHSSKYLVTFLVILTVGAKYDVWSSHVTHGSAEARQL
jgi:hypothetical protein